jgi:hypothetical protein
VDVSKLSRAHWLVLGGTVAVLVGTLLLPWYSVDLGIGASIDVSAWDTGVLGKLAVLGMLVMVAGCIAFAVDMTDQLPIPLPMAMLALGAFEALMAILKWIDVHDATAFGLYLTLIGGLVAAYGGYELGGRLNVPYSSTGPTGE